MDDGFKVIMGLLLLVGLILGGTYALDRAECIAKTSGMGFSVDYSVFGGCRIEVESNHWIPLESYYFKEE